MEIYLIAGSAALTAILLVTTLIQAKHVRALPQSEDLRQLSRHFDEQLANYQVVANNFQQGVQSQAAEDLRALGEKLDRLTKQSYEQQLAMQKSFNEALGMISRNNLTQTQAIGAALAKLQESNEKRLDQMRETVDEKLTSTLNRNLSESFKSVSEQLSALYKSLGEMRQLSNGVTNNVTALNRVLTNVKARGTWAEVQLSNILDQTIPGMYVENYAPNNGRDRVEFAVRIPSGIEKDHYVYLPIDSKLPIEDYIRLCTAADAADAEKLREARARLERRVKDEAREITKYISVPATTPYAIMYLATEGLYSEIASSPNGLPEELQREFNVMIAGPTTITALLNSMSLGFKAVAINEKAEEVRRLLEVSKAQYEKFGILLEKARKKISDAGRTIEEAQQRSDIIQRKLKGVSAISAPADDFLLNDDDEAADAPADPEDAAE